MDNMHAPIIPSGPTSNGTGANGIKTAGQTLPELQAKKDNIEAELKALSNVLDSHGVNMSTPLTSVDGFPRADLDVAQIRITRTRIICLKNDYKALMSVIEKAIHEHFASQAALPAMDNASSSSSISIDRTNVLASRPAQILEPPFAKVNTVVENSPAAEAGLEQGDEIRVFGYVNLGNHNGLRRVAECVQGNEGHNVLIKVSRPGIAGARREMSITLTPRKDWGGRGMLGCHILPL